MRYTLTLLSFLITSAALAANAPPPPDVKPVPDGTPNASDAPPVTIKPSGKGRVEEYRSANGRVYMIKVIPKVGKPYYLIDQKGEGFFTRRDTFEGGMQPPMWKVKEF